MTRLSGELILFGGYDGTNHLNDTWALKFNQGSYSWRKLDLSVAPHPRINSSMAFYPNGRMILFGGYDGENYLNDTWALDSNFEKTGNQYYTWNSLSLPFEILPEPICGASMAFNYAKGQMILFGGTHKTIDGTFAYLNDTWALSINDDDSYKWSLLTPPEGSGSPSPRAFASMNFDTSGQMILFGGQDKDHHLLTETWSFAPPPNFVLVSKKLELDPSTSYRDMEFCASSQLRISIKKIRIRSFY